MGKPPKQLGPFTIRRVKLTGADPVHGVWLTPSPFLSERRIRLHVGWMHRTLPGLRNEALARCGRLNGSLALLLTFTGCSGDAPENGGEIPGAIPEEAGEALSLAPEFPLQGALRSGSLTLHDGSLLFHPCGASEPMSIQDTDEGDARAFLADVNPDGMSPVTVLLRLSGDRLSALRYAGLEGWSCDVLPPEGVMEARGNEPFWFVRLLEDRVRVVTPDLPDGIEYFDLEWVPSTGDGWTLSAERRHADGVEFLTLTIEERRCTDSMSGAWYPYAASLSAGFVSGDGCALEGRRSVPR
ncbi:MAG: hypothetical protein WD960_12705 [Gemmatimonadota bacterium]